MTEAETERTHRVGPVDTADPQEPDADDPEPRDDGGDAARVAELTAEVERLKGELDVMRAEGQAPPSPRDVLLRISMWLVTVSMVLLLGWMFGADSRPMAALIFVIVIGVVTVAMVLLTKGK